MADDDTRLSQIATHWSLILEAHGENPAARNRAQNELLLRYCAPIYRYLRAMVRDDAAAEDLCQEFAMRFVRGDFHNADPNRGRFRNYLKTAVCHLARETGKRQIATCDVAADAETIPDDPFADEDQRFLRLWRDEILDRTWTVFANSAKGGSEKLYEVLRLKSTQPELNSGMLAAEMTRRHGVPFTAAGIRQSLHRARAKFVDLLRAEVAASIPTSDGNEVDDELAELELLVYCTPTAAAQ